KARQPHAEEGAAPLVQALERAVDPVLLERVGELGGRVARPSEGGRELGVDRLDAARRGEAVGVLARDVEPVLEAPQVSRRLLPAEQLGVAREALELGERPGQAAPEHPHLRGVALSDTPARCHVCMLLRGDRIRSPAVGGKASVLVVEDDASLRMLYRLNLEFEDFEVADVATVAEARSAVSARRPGLVLLDAHLEGESTDDLLDELRAAGIPVVVATGSTDLERYRDRADDVLAKPFRPADLVAVVQRLTVR